MTPVASPAAWAWPAGLAQPQGVQPPPLLASLPAPSWCCRRQGRLAAVRASVADGAGPAGDSRSLGAGDYWERLAADGSQGDSARPAGHSSGPATAAGVHSSGAGATSSQPNPSGREASEYVEVGVFGAPHGVHGEVRVTPLTDFPEERLGTPGLRWARPPEGSLLWRKGLRELHLEAGRRTLYRGQEQWLVKLAGYDSPEAADALRRWTLLVRAAERAPLADADEFYVQQLVGLAVHDAASGRRLGTVVDLFDGTGTYDVLRIELADSPEEVALQGVRSALLPFARELVPAVDLAAGVMRVAPPDGWLDTAVSSLNKRQRKAAAPGAKRWQQRRQQPKEDSGSSA